VHVDTRKVSSCDEDSIENVLMNQKLKFVVKSEEMV